MSVKVENSKFNSTIEISGLVERSGGALDELWKMPWIRTAIGNTDDLVETAENIGGELRYKSQVIVIIAAGVAGSMIRGILPALQSSVDVKQIVIMVDSLSSADYRNLAETLENRDFSLIASAISEETIAQRASFACVRKMLKDKYGPSGMSARTTVIAGSESNYFADEASRSGGRVLALPEGTDAVFAADTMAMLLPLAAAGIDVKAYLDGFKEMLADTWWDADGDRYSLYMAAGGQMEDVIVWQRELKGFCEWITDLHECAGYDSRLIFMPEEKNKMRENAYGSYFVLENEDTDTMLPAFPGANQEGSLNLLLQKCAEETFSDEKRPDPRTKIIIEGSDPYEFGRLAAFIEISFGITSLILEN